MTKERLIHEAAMEILGDVGIKFHNDEALSILQENGIKVEDQIAYFSEDQVMHWVKQAPASFRLHARNPRYDVVIGEGQVNPSPAYGCAFIAERDGSRRLGTLADYVKCVKLIHACDVYQINGGIMIQPGDVPSETAPIDMFYTTLLHSDKAILISTGEKKVMTAIMEAGCELFGGREAMVEKPRMFSLINTNSPLSLDGKMLDCLMTLAKYGQPAILSPAATLGATGPLGEGGTLASGTAENLAGIALAQMIRPGTPVVFGMQSTAVDMKGMSFACAAPEGAKMQGFGARMAAFYGLPSRGGGSQTDAPVVNAQAGYESMLTFYSAYSHGINLVLEAGGVLASVNATSFDKMIVDFEIIRQVKAACAPLEINEETIGMDEIKENAHSGNFLTSEYTLDNFMDLYNPRIGTRNDKEAEYFEKNIDAEMQRLLTEYRNNPPQLDQETKERVKKILVETADIDKAQLERIDALSEDAN